MGKYKPETTRYLVVSDVGQCVAICPLDCISISGREISMEDFLPLPRKEKRAAYEDLFSLMFSRRSIRDFKADAVPEYIVDKIISAASTSPIGIPPSDVRVLVLNGQEKVFSFSSDMINHFRYVRKFFSPKILWLMRPFMKKINYEAFNDFIQPLMNILINGHAKGEDWLLYNAPLAIYFYNSPYADSADSYIAATYSMLAAESLGLGSCMIGTINPFLEKGGKEIKEKYGIDSDAGKGIMLVYGYPKYKYKYGVKRSFGKVTYY
jgi:nitroreductase